MLKVGLYLMNYKGYKVLSSIISTFGSEIISFVVSSSDNNVQNDYYNDIKNVCADNGINFIKRSEEIPSSAFECTDYFVAVGWRWLIPDCDKLIVLHDSLLPKYRGFAPLVNMLIAGEKEIGVTALFASDGYDEGDIIDKVSVNVEYPIKIKRALDLIGESYACLVINVLYQLNNDKSIKTYKQVCEEATYSMWLDEEDYFIDWRWGSDKICRFIDATGYPYNCAKTNMNGEIVRVIDAEQITDVVIQDRERHIGKIIFVQDKKPVVICGRGLVRINKIDGINEIKFRTRFS